MPKKKSISNLALISKENCEIIYSKENISGRGLATKIQVAPNTMFQHGNDSMNFYSQKTKKVINQTPLPVSRFSSNHGGERSNIFCKMKLFKESVSKSKKHVKFSGDNIC